MQITLPDEAKIDQRAKAAGFATVEAYLLHLLACDAKHTPPDARQSSNAEWIREFREFIATMPPRHADLDDSRESIYPVR